MAAICRAAKSLRISVILVCLVSHAAMSTKFYAVSSLPYCPSVCAMDPPTLTVSAKSRLHCSVQCNKSNPGCKSFNYKKGAHEQQLSACDLYKFTPQSFDVLPNCEYWQEGNSEVPTDTMPRTDAEGCSFPYTYNGNLYYNCTPGVTSPCEPYGCLLVNRTAAVCNAPADFKAEIISENINVPTEANPVPVKSVSGWIIMMQRVDTSYSWNKGWSYYRDGFGVLGSNFWLGLERVHQLTTAGGATYRMRFEMKTASDGEWFSAEYWSVVIGDESTEEYRINLAGYVGDAGNGMEKSGRYYHNGMKFTTKDRDNDGRSGENCSYYRDGGWWFSDCYYVCLTCSADYVGWWSLPSYTGKSTTEARMMIKPQQ